MRTVFLDSKVEIPDVRPPAVSGVGERLSARIEMSAETDCRTLQNRNLFCHSTGSLVNVLKQEITDVAGHRRDRLALRREPWMGALTSSYSVDNEKVLREVRAGDQIMGKVYDGETMLHHLEIVAVTAARVASN
jgi:hypothetical protein